MGGMIGREAPVVLSKLSQVMAEKREAPISQLRGWVNEHIAITVVISYSQMISGA